MKGPVGLGSSYVGIPPPPPSHGAGPGLQGGEVGEDWSRSGPRHHDIMESTKERQPEVRKDTEEEETDDELVIEESETGPAAKANSGVKEPEPAPELTGKLRIMYVRRGRRGGRWRRRREKGRGGRQSLESYKLSQ